MRLCCTYLCNYKAIIVLLIAFCLGNSMRSQNSDLFKKATELVYSNPDEAIKIGEHILKTTEDAKLKASIDVMVAKAYFIKGDYKNAIEYVYKAGGNQVAFSDYETQISINLLKAKLFRLLYLDTQHEQYLKNAERLLPKIIVKKRRDSLSSCVFLEKISMHLERQRMDEAQSLLDKTSAQFYDFIGSHSVLKGKLYIVEEKVLSNKAEYDSALVYLNKALALTTSEGYNNSYEKAQIYNQLGYLYLQKGAFKKSEEMLFIALRFAEVLGNPFLSEKINKNLSINYLTSNQKNKYKVYNDEFLVLNNKMELIEQESVSTAYSIISNENETYLAQEEEKYSNYRQIILMYISLIVLVGLFFLIKSQWKKKRLKDIVKYLEISRNNFIETRLSNKMPAKRIIIPEDTEKSILADRKSVV